MYFLIQGRHDREIKKLIQDLKKIYKQPEYQVVYNDETSCVDVVFNGNVVSQHYLRRDGTFKDSRVKYQYVGDGNGDYIKTLQKYDRPNYTRHKALIKDVSSSRESD